MTARIIPIVTRHALERARMDHGLLFFTRISHRDLDRDVNLVTDDEPYSWDGVTWEKGWFELGLLTDSDRPPQTKFSFPNVDQKRMALLEGINGRARIDYWVISTGNFDLSKSPRTVLEGVTVQPVYRALYLKLIDVEITPERVSGTLINFDPRGETVPTGSITARLAPGVAYR